MLVTFINLFIKDRNSWKGWCVQLLLHTWTDQKQACIILKCFIGSGIECGIRHLLGNRFQKLKKDLIETFFQLMSQNILDWMRHTHNVLIRQGMIFLWKDCLKILLCRGLLATQNDELEFSALKTFLVFLFFLITLQLSFHFTLSFTFSPLYLAIS